MFSERGQLSQAIPQFHVGRMLNENERQSRCDSNRSTTKYRVNEDCFLCFGWRYERQQTLPIRIAAVTLACDSAITVARFRPSKVRWWAFILGSTVLRPELPFTGVSGPSGPEIAENISKKVFWGVCRKVPKNTRESLKRLQKARKSVFLDFFGFFSGTYLHTLPPPKTFFETFLRFWARKAKRLLQMVARVATTVPDPLKMAIVKGLQIRPGP